MRKLRYTLVCGVDAKHLQQLAVVWPTWKRHKPSLLSCPMIVFRDKDQVEDEEVRRAVDHPKLSVYAWPLGDVRYDGTPGHRWFDPQRHKMLTGFVYVPALFARTRYWLKLDTDTVATGCDDWVDQAWFRTKPAMVSHPWGYTKPPGQMAELDRWVAKDVIHLSALNAMPPLGLVPEPGAKKLRHKRIISWCAFFNTEFTRMAAERASSSCGPFRLPVPSQDGFLWYMAKRLKLGIVRVNMKQRGWVHTPGDRGIRKAIEQLPW